MLAGRNLNPERFGRRRSYDVGLKSAPLASPLVVSSAIGVLSGSGDLKWNLFGRHCV